MNARGRSVSDSRFEDEVRRFEETVFGQRPVASEHYGEDYFAAGWREGGNRYELETRRRVEDRNPALIKEVFAPARASTSAAARGS